MAFAPEFAPSFKPAGAGSVRTDSFKHEIQTHGVLISWSDDFWSMLPHYHGQIWSASDPARLLGISEPTVRRYRDLLTGAYLARPLPQWHENLGKRQVKAPKAYVRDCGLLHALLGIASSKVLLAHPKCGTSWEGNVIEEVLKALDAYFWATTKALSLILCSFIAANASASKSNAPMRP